jgi:dienelactone hydrolase
MRGVAALVAAAVAFSVPGPLSASAAADPAIVQVEVKDGPRPATLGALLYRPAGEAPFPAVIFLHGCAGQGRRENVWAPELQGEGYLVLALDSFTARRINRVCGDPSLFASADRAADVFAAVRYLQSRPEVDRTRIGVIGWSHGGSTTLAALAQQPQHPGEPLAAAITFYPGCAGAAEWTDGPPLLMLLGQKDNWTLATRCIHLANRMTAAGRTVQTMVYPNAAHGFDDPGLIRPVVVRDARRGRGATMAYDPKAYADSRRQVREFLGQYLERK